MASNAKLKLILFAGLIPTLNISSPFDMGEEISCHSPGAGVLYGAHAPSRNNEAQYITAKVPATWTTKAIIGTGTPTDEIQNLNIDGAFIEAGGALARADNLSVIALVNGIPIARVAKGSAPAAGQFSVRDNAGTITVLYGTAYGEGTKLEVLLIGGVAAGLPAASNGVTTVATLVAHLDQQVASTEYMFAGVDDIVIEALGC